MKPKFFPLLASSLVFCASSPAADVTSVASGEWTATTVWSNASAPAAGNDYIIKSPHIVDSPVAGSSTAPGSTLTFGGDAITVESGALLRLRHTSNGGNTFVQYNLNSLKLDNGSTLQSYNTALGNVTRILLNPLALDDTGTVNLRIQSDSTGAYTNSLTLAGAISGEANIDLKGTLQGQTGERRVLNVTSANNLFSGNWIVEGTNTTDDARRLVLRSSAANALGTGNVTLNTRATLAANANDSLNSLAGIELATTTSTLALGGRAWTNPSANLTVTNGTVQGSGSSVSISSFTQAAGTATLTNLTTAGSLSQSGGTLSILTSASIGTNLTATGTIQMPVSPSSPAPITVAGNANLTGATLTPILSVSPVGQTFNLLAYGGTLTGTPAVNTGDVGRLTPAVNTGSGTNDIIKLSFTGSVANLVWTGSANDNWDNNLSQNFTNSGSPDVFRLYDNVLFDDSTTFTNPLLVGNLAAGTVTFDGAGDYTLGGAGALVGSTSLVKSGTHKLTIVNTATNTFTGPITINSGILQVGSAGTAGSLGTGAITNDASLVFDRTDSLTVSNVISGTGTLTQNGTSNLILTGNNSYSGGTTISAGTLQVGNAGASGAIGTGPVTNNGTLAINRTDALALSNLISGTGAFTQAGTGTTTFSTAQSYSGLTTIGAGTLALSGGNNRIPAANTVAFSGTSALDLTNTDQTLATLSLPVQNASSASTVTGSGKLLINGAVPFNFGVSGTLNAPRSVTMDMTGLSNFEFDSTTQVFRVGTQPGTGTSTTNSGTLVFQAADITTVKALSFLLGDQAGTGSGGTNTFRMGEATTINANTINIGASGRSNATLEFNTGLTTPKVTIRGTNGTSAATSWEVGRVANFSTTPNTWSANVNLSAGETDAKVTTLRIGIINTTNQTNRFGTQNSTFTMGRGTLEVGNLVIGEQSGTHTNNTAGGVYAANGTFTLNHADGTVTATSIRLAENTGTLTGGTRSVSGTLNLDDGTLAAGEIRLGDQTATSPASITQNFNFFGGTLTHLTGQDLTITGLPLNLTGTGIFNAATGRTIATAANTPVSGSGGFTKTGAGTLILAGTNTYSGPTLLNEGTLGGTGSASSPITAATGTTIAPGTSIGTMATAGITLPAGSTLAIEIDSTTDTADQLTATGPVDITGSTLTFTETGSGTIPAGTKLVILDYTGQTLTGTFAGLAEGATVNVGSNSFTLSYTDSSRITLTSTTVGDPYSSWATNQITNINPAAPAGFDEDADGDGLDNGLEWILGGNPLAQDAASLVTTTASAAGGLTLAFSRADESIGLATLVVEYDADLTGTWTAVDVEGTPPFANGVTVNITPGSPEDSISVNIPAVPNAVAGKLFARLKATKP